MSVRSLRRHIAQDGIPAYRMPGSRLLRVRLADADACLRPPAHHGERVAATRNMGPPADRRGDDQTGSDSSLPPIPTIPSFDPIVGYLLAYNVTSRMVEDGELFAGLQSDDLGAAIAEHTLKVIHHGQETGLIDPMPAGATLQELGAYMDDLMTAAMDWPTLGRVAGCACCSVQTTSTILPPWGDRTRSPALRPYDAATEHDCLSAGSLSWMDPSMTAPNIRRSYAGILSHAEWVALPDAVAAPMIPTARSRTRRCRAASGHVFT